MHSFRIYVKYCEISIYAFRVANIELELRLWVLHTLAIGDSVCTVTEFRCEGGLCIDMSRRCDRVTDCPQGEDEYRCQGNQDVTIVTMMLLSRFDVTDNNNSKKTRHMLSFLHFISLHKLVDIIMGLFTFVSNWHVRHKFQVIYGRFGFHGNELEVRNLLCRSWLLGYSILDCGHSHLVAL